ncbi:HAMP domain-containing sensor histidine kinase [Streptomyces sp. NPDC005355]|uniref:sensor histidine kinase n=1 Tax=Streptomyces sp. NPDC005355 TaxID=3157038 RepID=UPI0033A677CF
MSLLRGMSLVGGMSVRAKAVLAAAGTVAFAIALCMLALVLALQHNLRDSASTDARKTAVAIKGQLTKTKPESGRMLLVMPGLVTVRDAEGRTVAPGSPITPAEPAELPESAEAAASTGTAGTAGTAESADPPKVAGARPPDGAAPAATPADDGYSVKVDPSTTALDNATGLLLREVAPAAAGLVLFVAALSWLLVGRALRPVAAIQREVTEITERDLHRRVPVPTARDEISRLARTMNATLDRLQRAMTRQRQFVADASHELRSPIAAVRAQLELALAHPSRTDWPTAVHKALRDTERLQSVASDLLLLARLDAQEAPPRSPVDLAALMAEEIRRHPGTVTAGPGGAGGAGGDGRDAVVTGSRVQLSRLLTNLTDNARRHARATVSVTVGVHDDTVELTVDDDGPGIPECDRERVFERFTRLDHARARQDGGTGLGLAIANDIAHAHGGTLTVHTSPWGGARLRLCLPRARMS